MSVPLTNQQAQRLLADIAADEGTWPRVFTIGGATVRIWPDYMEAVFLDGLKVPAAANYDHDSIQRAWSLGYKGDTWAMSLCHELLHSLIMTGLGSFYSPVLRGVAVRNAGGCKESIVDKGQSAWEERVVLDFQRYCNGQTLSAELYDLRDRCGLDVTAVAARVREMCDT